MSQPAPFDVFVPDGPEPAPSGPLRVQLLRLAHQLVAGQGVAEFPLTVIIDVPGSRVRLVATGPEWGACKPPEAGPPIVRAIMEAAGPAPIPAKRLASQTGYTFNSHFRRHLSDLVRGGHLLHSPDGYFLPGK